MPRSRPIPFEVVLPGRQLLFVRAEVPSNDFCFLVGSCQGNEEAANFTHLPLNSMNI